MTTVTHGSTLAVMKDGRHLAICSGFASQDDFKATVKILYNPVRYELERTWCAWGHDVVEYTPAEFREMFELQ